MLLLLFTKKNVLKVKILSVIIVQRIQRIKNTDFAYSTPNFMVRPHAEFYIILNSNLTTEQSHMESNAK